MHFCKQNQHVWEKIQIEATIHLRSHNIPLSYTYVFALGTLSCPQISCALFQACHVVFGIFHSEIEQK